MTSFQATTAAQRLAGIEQAVYTMLAELANLRMTGLAALLLDTLRDQPDVQRLQVGITEQRLPPLFGTGDDQRVLHVSVRTKPGDALVELAQGTVVALVTGEGSYELERSSDLAQGLTALYRDEPASAIAKLAQDMDSHFLPVHNQAQVDPLV